MGASLSKDLADPKNKTPSVLASTLLSIVDGNRWTEAKREELTFLVRPELMNLVRFNFSDSTAANKTELLDNEIINDKKAPPRVFVRFIYWFIATTENTSHPEVFQQFLNSDEQTKRLILQKLREIRSILTEVKNRRIVKDTTSLSSSTASPSSKQINNNNNTRSSASSPVNTTPTTTSLTVASSNNINDGAASSSNSDTRAPTRKDFKEPLTLDQFCEMTDACINHVGSLMAVNPFANSTNNNNNPTAACINTVTQTNVNSNNLAPNKKSAIMIKEPSQNSSIQTVPRTSLLIPTSSYNSNDATGVTPRTTSTFKNNSNNNIAKDAAAKQAQAPLFDVVPEVAYPPDDFKLFRNVFEKELRVGDHLYIREEDEEEGQRKDCVVVRPVTAGDRAYVVTLVRMKKVDLLEYKMRRRDVLDYYQHVQQQKLHQQQPQPRQQNATSRTTSPGAPANVNRRRDSVWSNNFMADANNNLASMHSSMFHASATADFHPNSSFSPLAPTNSASANANQNQYQYQQQQNNNNQYQSLPPTMPSFDKIDFTLVKAKDRASQFDFEKEFRAKNKKTPDELMAKWTREYQSEYPAILDVLRTDPEFFAGHCYQLREMKIGEWHFDVDVIKRVGYGMTYLETTVSRAGHDACTMVSRLNEKTILQRIRSINEHLFAVEVPAWYVEKFGYPGPLTSATDHLPNANNNINNGDFLHNFLQLQNNYNRRGSGGGGGFDTSSLINASFSSQYNNNRNRNADVSSNYSVRNNNNYNNNTNTAASLVHFNNYQNNNNSAVTPTTDGMSMSAFRDSSTMSVMGAGGGHYNNNAASISPATPHLQCNSPVISLGSAISISKKSFVSIEDRIWKKENETNNNNKTSTTTSTCSDEFYPMDSTALIFAICAHFPSQGSYIEVGDKYGFVFTPQPGRLVTDFVKPIIKKNSSQDKKNKNKNHGDDDDSGEGEDEEHTTMRRFALPALAAKKDSSKVLTSSPKNNNEINISLATEEEIINFLSDCTNFGLPVVVVPKLTLIQRLDTFLLKADHRKHYDIRQVEVNESRNLAGVKHYRMFRYFYNNLHLLHNHHSPTNSNKNRSVDVDDFMDRSITGGNTNNNNNNGSLSRSVSVNNNNNLCGEEHDTPSQEILEIEEAFDIIGDDGDNNDNYEGECEGEDDGSLLSNDKQQNFGSSNQEASFAYSAENRLCHLPTNFNELDFVQKLKLLNRSMSQSLHSIKKSYKSAVSMEDLLSPKNNNNTSHDNFSFGNASFAEQQQQLLQQQSALANQTSSPSVMPSSTATLAPSGSSSHQTHLSLYQEPVAADVLEKYFSRTSNTPSNSNSPRLSNALAHHMLQSGNYQMKVPIRMTSTSNNNNTSSSSENTTSTDLRASNSAGTTQSTSTAEYSPGLQAHNTRDSTSSPSERGANSFNPLSQQQSSNHNQQNNAADVNGIRDNGASVESQKSSSSSPRSSAAHYAATTTTTSDQHQQLLQQQQQQQNFAGSIITITDASGLEEYLERFLVEFKMHFIVLQNMIVDEQVERVLLYSQIMLQTCAYRNAEVFGEYAKTFVPEMQIYKEKIKIQGFFDRYGNMNLKDGSSFFAWTEKYNNSQKALGLVDNLVNPDKIKQIILDEVKSIDDFIELREALDEPRIDFQSCMNLRKHQLPHYVTMRLQEMIALAKDERSWRNNYASAPNQLLERLRRTLPAEFVLDPTQVTYQMEVDVGSGTFGSVRPAHIVPKKFDCVAKIISSKDRSRLEGGIYEAKVYAELRNAGIVTFLGATIINNAIHPSLVILLERAIFDFDNFLRPTCTIPLSLDRIYRYSLQIASALRYLHTAKEVGFETGGGSPTSALLAPNASQWNRSLTQSASASPLTSSSSSVPTSSKKVIVHLDLKPKNLLFFEGDVVKIADLGSVKEMDEENTHGEASGVNVTFAYSPPEYFIHRELEERRVMNDRKRSAFFGGNKDNNINNKHELHARTSTANQEAKNNDDDKDNQPSAEDVERQQKEKKQQQESAEAKRLKKLEKKRQREEAKQLNKHKNVLFSPSFDIFSFGVILYRMISNGRASDLDQEHQAHRYVAGQLEVVKKNIRLQREQKRGARNKAREERRQQEKQHQDAVVAASSTSTIDTSNNSMNPDQQQPSKLKNSDTEDFMKRIEMMSKGPLPNSNNKVTINNSGEDVENKKEQEKPLIQETSSNSPPSLGAMVLKTSDNSVGNKTNKNDSTTDESEKIENDDDAADQHQAQDFTSLNNYAIPRPSTNIKAQNANANDDDDDNAGAKNNSSPKNTCPSSSSSISSTSSDDDDHSVDLDEAALYSDDRGMERKCVIEHIIPEHRDFTHDHGKKLIALCKSCLMMHPKHRPHDGWDLSRKLLQICEEEAPEVFKAWGISKADLVRLNHKQVGEAHQNNQNNLQNNNEIVVDSGARPRAATITPSQVQKEHNNNTNTGSLLEFRSFSMTPAQKQDEENIRLKKVQSQSQKQQQQQQQSEERQESPCGAVENNAALLLPASSDDKNSEDNQLAQRIASGASGASNGSNGNNNNNTVNINNNASFLAVHSGSNEGTSHFVGHHHQQQQHNNNYNYHHDPYEVTYDQHADYNQNDDKAVDYNQGYKPARLEHGQQNENDDNNSTNQTGVSATYAPDVTSTSTSDQ